MADAASDPLALLRGLRATRAFSDERVDDEMLHAILEVARWTGSAMNQQEWQLIVVTRPDTLRRLAAASPSAGHLAGAPLAVAVVMPGERKIGEAFDEGRMAERIMLAARAVGLASGMAWVSADEDAVRDALGLPDDRTVRTVVTVGHPDAATRRPSGAAGTARRPLDETVHYERWGKRQP